MKTSTIVGFCCTAILFTASNYAATIPTVPVGNSGNLPDNTGFGAVGYAYRIATTEVTNAQYVDFLNGVDPTGANTLALYSISMTGDIRGGINFTSGAANGSKYVVKPGRDNNPVVYVSWYDSIRFANWMNNGMGSGDTENGAYTLLGVTPTPSNGNSITRNSGATWWLPSEDEWYKAAYHKNDGVTGNYWDYATSTDAVPYSDQPPGSDAPDPSNTANFFKNDFIANGYDDGYAVTGSPLANSAQSYVTDVGAYTAATSPYGTFDQGGNVWERNEGGGTSRGVRGGSWSNNFNVLPASFRTDSDPTLEFNTVGFRVASIPEPAGIIFSLSGVLMLMLRRGRNRSRVKSLVSRA